MGLRMDSGGKFDQGKINRILTLVEELGPEEVEYLSNKLISRVQKLNRQKGQNTDTIQT